MYREEMKMAVIVIIYALFIGAELIATAVGRWLVFKKVGLARLEGNYPVLQRKRFVPQALDYQAVLGIYCDLCRVLRIVFYSSRAWIFRAFQPNAYNKSFVLYIYFIRGNRCACIGVCNTF